MNRPPRLPPAWQVMLLGVAGALGGWLFRNLPGNGPVWFCRHAADLFSSVFTLWLRALAITVVVSSLILGAVGLEPMRALGKICFRTGSWMAASALAAVLVAFGTTWALFPGRGDLPAGQKVPPNVNFFALSPEAGYWAALVLLGLGFAYYRNQIDEAHGRFITRICQGIEGMLQPLLALTARLLPWAIFANLLAGGTSHHPNGPQSQSAPGTNLAVLAGADAALVRSALEALLAGWAVFGLLVLPVSLWLLTRINPWRVLLSMLPAAALAFVRGSPVDALPVTMHSVRHDLHVSNRVASVVVSICAVFQREGLALGLVTFAVSHGKAQGVVPGWQVGGAIIVAGWLIALGAGALPMAEGLAPLFFSRMIGDGEDWLVVAWAVGFLATRGGAALSVLSHACAAAVIARGEGEFWVPGPPPTSDELQGLKNDLASADN